MMPTLPPLQAIRVFNAVARHLNLTKAAAEMGITQSAISYQIKTLESFVGAPLLIRKARGVELSERGCALAPIVEHALDEIRQALETAKKQSETTLVITTVPTFATNWLVPRIAAFQSAHSHIAVRIDSTPRMIDLAAEGFDAAIRTGNGNWPGTICHSLFDVSFTPMCSPDYVKHEGPIEVPADLMSRRLIDVDDPWWQMWFTKAGIDAPSVTESAGIDVETQHLAASIAVNGHGVAILTPQFVMTDLEAGRLLILFDISVTLEQKYYLVYPETLRASRKIRLFKDWLRAKLENSNTVTSKTIRSQITAASTKQKK